MEDAWRTIQDAKRIYGMIAEARNSVPEPGAQRGEGATTAPPATLGTIGGVPIEKIIEDMRKANMSTTDIHRYLTQAGVGLMTSTRSKNGTP